MPAWLSGKVMAEGISRLKSLTMDELTGVINIYPWFGAARMELCERMSKVGGSEWGKEQYADAAMYIPSRTLVFDIMRSASGADYSDKDVRNLVKKTTEYRRTVKVVGGDFFSYFQIDETRYGFYIAAIIFCGTAIIDGLMTIGLLTALVALLSQLTGPLGNITSIIPRYYSLLASGERLKLEADPDTKYLSKEEIDSYYTNEFKAIKLDKVNFSYLDKYGNKVEALKDFSLDINKNERILIKGHSGGGKTTLLKIILSLVKPESGNIYLLDKDEHNLSLEYEKLFAYVPQDNLLMEGTIEEVVSLFSKDINVDKFNEALELSASKDFVNALTLKEKTFLNEKGSGLSLGEMERIAIARALYNDAPILLLDECSASLDLETEKKVSNIKKGDFK